MPRAKKKVEPKAAETPIEATPMHEPDEPELKAATEASPDQPGEALSQSAPPVEGEVEALAEAADTFEQAFEERQPSEAKEPVAVEVVAPKVRKAAAKRKKAPTKEESPGQDKEPTPKVQDESDEPEFTPEPGPPPRLERLQKILSQAGVASRRHAEEMITEGRVQVNGKVVSELGSKADPTRDHIRVDGKLLQGAERLRYFVLNKPRGYVTTVSDPEGRSTVMEFFKKLPERLYPVGRLDYLSEGLLLVTNDGDLANKLTKAATGVEKTYLVKVSGQPTEEELDQLREGVAIDRTKPGEGRVHTSPASIRQVRQGDNPWYEVVLTEGRNRELRKMFEEIGHFVEKIRRVGYGPLVLDVEPGNFRELDPDELGKLRLAAEGKWRKPKPKEPKSREFRRIESRPAAARGPGRKPMGEFPARARSIDRADRPAPARPARQNADWQRPGASHPAPPDFRRSSSARPAPPPRAGEFRTSGSGRPAPAPRGGDFGSGDLRRSDRKPQAAGQGFNRPKPGPGGSKPFEGAKPRWNRPGAGAQDRRDSVRGGDRREQEARPSFNRPRPPARSSDRPTVSGSSPRPPRRGLAPGQVQFDRPRPPRPGFGSSPSKPAGGYGRSGQSGGQSRSQTSDRTDRPSRGPGSPQGRSGGWKPKPQSRPGRSTGARTRPPGGGTDTRSRSQTRRPGGPPRGKRP
jgi:23S rRNA pseudouridine2605 synthase